MSELDRNRRHRFATRAIHTGQPPAASTGAVITPIYATSTYIQESPGVHKGAYTDARQDRPGLFAQANGGTLFLGEIAELPLEVQPKLLQALEAGTIRPLGHTRETVVDVRLIAATNQPLEQRVNERLFRADLYHRINMIRLELPPLRERTEDIDELVDVLIRRIGLRLRKPSPAVSVDALRWIRAYRWPGNVRELASTLERAIALAEHDTCCSRTWRRLPG